MSSSEKKNSLVSHKKIHFHLIQKYFLSQSLWFNQTNDSESKIAFQKCSDKMSTVQYILVRNTYTESKNIDTLRHLLHLLQL